MEMIRETRHGNLMIRIQKGPGLRYFLFLMRLLCCLFLTLDPSVMEAEEKEADKEGYQIEIGVMEERLFKPPDTGAMDTHDPRLLPENWKTEDQKAKSPKMRSLEEPSLEESLLLAVGMGDIEEVNRLLDRGARINYRQGSSGLTPLMVAEKEAVVSVLLQRGANPNAVDQDGATPLHHAVLKEEAEGMIALLVQGGADVNAVAPGRSRETPILSAKQNYFEGNDHVRGERIIRLLAKCGADVNAADDLGYTLLITSVVNRKMDLVRLMVELGADTGKRTVEGKTALAYARELGFGEIVDFLQKEGVSRE